METTVQGWVLANLIITSGAVLQAATGLGAGLLVVPLLALLSMAWVPGPLIFASLALSGLMAFRGRAHVHTRGMGLLLAGILLGSGLGAYLLGLATVSWLAPLFGVLILLAVLISALGVHTAATPRVRFAAGILSGFMGTVAAIGAPVLALLYQHESGPRLRATLAFLYTVCSCMMLGLLSLAERFGWPEVRMGAVLMPGFLLGYLLAGRLAARLDRGHTRTAVLVVSGASALLLIAKGIAW